MNYEFASQYPQFQAQNTSFLRVPGFPPVGADPLSVDYTNSMGLLNFSSQQTNPEDLNKQYQIYQKQVDYQLELVQKDIEAIDRALELSKTEYNPDYSPQELRQLREKAMLKHQQILASNPFQMA